MTFGLLDHSKMHNQLYANIDWLIEYLDIK